MVGLIFGIIFILAGIGISIAFARTAETRYKNDGYGNYIYDDNHNRVTETTYPLKKWIGLVLVIALLLGSLSIFLGCVTTVDTGHVGIVKTFGRVEDYTFDSGMHFKTPWKSVVQMNNQVQKLTLNLSCFSSDIQEVTTDYTINYQISRTNAQALYRNVGVNYPDTVITPVAQESVKTIMANYTAEDLIGQREKLAAEIETLLSANLDKYNIEVVSSAIENMDFTDSFTTAVEAKQVAAQNKLQAQIEQEQKTMEAEQAANRSKIEAEAAAEVAKIQALADMEVAQISSDSAEYQGKKEAAIALQRLASINGWTVVSNSATGINELYKASGEKVTAEDLKLGTERLIEYYYTQTWDGKLPTTVVGNEDVSSIIIGK
jgi:regulator of protease activity HflC (stomatin/prohibitin superfamily)